MPLKKLQHQMIINKIAKNVSVSGFCHHVATPKNEMYINLITIELIDGPKIRLNANDPADLPIFFCSDVPYDNYTTNTLLDIGKILNDKFLLDLNFDIGENFYCMYNGFYACYDKIIITYKDNLETEQSLEFYILRSTNGHTAGYLTIDDDIAV